MNYKKLIFSLLILLLFSSCASNVKNSVTTAKDDTIEYDEYDDYDDYETVSDPFEKINRKTFDFNIWLLTKVVKPLLITYDFIVPDFLQSIFYNMADRFYDFTYLANSILQLDYIQIIKLEPGSYKSSGLAKTELFISKECVSNIFSTK